MTIKLSLENQHRTIVFLPVRTWQEDDMTGMISFFYSRCTQCHPCERIMGADRVSERFLWQQQDYFLHFECNSQSVWIEAITGDLPEVTTDISLLFDYIQANFKSK